MVQNKLPLINSAHGSDTRNIINELIKLFNNMGYTYNESLQKAQDILEEAQQTNDMNTAVNERLDNIIASSGTSSTEVVDARGNHTVLGGRLNDNEKEIKENRSVVGGDFEELWDTPSQPPIEDIQWIHAPYDRLMDLWEGLRNENTTYISRETLGRDESGTYNIYKYIFEPENYEKTVILSGGLHGEEKAAQLLLYRLFYYICNKHNEFTQLSYARNKVRFIVIPCANPWGRENTKRGNVNGVDINRNFQYNWNAYNGALGTTEYKGTSPLSETETQYIDQILAEYADESVVYIDVHNTSESQSTGTNEVRYYCEVPMYGKGKVDIVRRVMDSLVPDGFTVNRNVFRTVNPSAYNQAYWVYGLNSVTPEHIPGGKDGASQYSAEDTTYGLRFISNVILQYAALKRRDLVKKEPFVIEQRVNTLQFNTTTLNAYEKIPDIGYNFKPETNGFLIISSELQFTQTSSTSNNWFSVQAFQLGNQVISPNTNDASGYEMISGYDGKASTISITRMVPVFLYNNVYKDVDIELYVKTDAGALTTRRVSLHIMFMPTENIPDYTRSWSTNGSDPTQSYPVEISIDG